MKKAVALRYDREKDRAPKDILVKKSSR